MKEYEKILTLNESFFYFRLTKVEEPLKNY